MMRISASLAVLVLASTVSTFAKTPGECLIEIKDVSRFDGACTFERDAAGDLTVWPGTESGEPLARLVAGEWTIEGSWRDPAAAAGKLVPLGEGSVLNKCWRGEHAMICAWPAGSRPDPLPTEYRGIWAVAGLGGSGRCVEGSDIRTDVTPLLIQQYESGCSPVSYSAKSDGLHLRLSCRGEGMTWMEDEVWQLEQNKTGKVWVRTTLGTSDLKDYDGTSLPDETEKFTVRLTPCP